MDITVDHLHLKQGIARAYAEFLQSLINCTGEDKQKYEDFIALKAACSTPALDLRNAQIEGGVVKVEDPQTGLIKTADIYIPNLPNLAARLDTNGFVGLQPQPQPLRSPSPVVRLGTEFMGLAIGLKQQYQGLVVTQDTKYYWLVADDVAVKVLRNLLPNLGNMQERAQLVLEYDDIDKKTKRTGQGSKIRSLVIELLGLASPKFDPVDLLKLGYVQKSRALNANPA